VNILCGATSSTYCHAEVPLRKREAAMCLLCEELWMPFELPPEAKARTFVADSPEAGSAPPANPSLPKSSSGDEEKPAAAE
jgi:hypothetical protein